MYKENVERKYYVIEISGSSTHKISITFEFQKRDIRNDIISHQKSGDKLGKGEMCPVRAAAEIVLRIHSYRLHPDKF